MSKQIIIAEQHRLAAVFFEDQIQELIVAKGSHQIGDVHLGVIENVLPSIDAAFVNIGGSERNGFIHVTDLGPIRQKRASAAITELVLPQQKILVQVMKEPTGNKGPRLTGNITLPGRFLVLMPYGRGVNLSRRIRDEDQRHHLRALAILIKPEGMGLLVRTEAEGVDEQSILDDLEALKKQWEKIQQKALVARPPAMLNRDEDFIQRVLRDTYSNQVNRIVVDTAFGQKRVKQQLINWNGSKMPPGLYVEHHREASSLLDYYRVNAAIREALKPRVDLPSGGYIVIEPTEALIVIDVNSGSFTRSATSRETVLWTNCEAATEIARQLRLRNVAGVIIVDFIDMESRRDQLQVLEHFSKALKADKAHPQIAQLTELGLVELTRKRQGQSIYEVFGRPCSACDGLGLLATLPGEKDRVDAALSDGFREETLLAGEIFKSNDEDDFSGDDEESSRSFGESDEDEKEGELGANHPTFRLDRRPTRSTGSSRPASPGRTSDRTSERQTPVRPPVEEGTKLGNDRNRRRNQRNAPPSRRSPEQSASLPQTTLPEMGDPLPQEFPDQTPPPGFFTPVVAPLIPDLSPTPVVDAETEVVATAPVVAPPILAIPVVVVEVQEEVELPLLVPPLVTPPPSLTTIAPPVMVVASPVIIEPIPEPEPTPEPPANRRRRRRTQAEESVVETPTSVTAETMATEVVVADETVDAVMIPTVEPVAPEVLVVAVSEAETITITAEPILVEVALSTLADSVVQAVFEVISEAGLATEAEATSLPEDTSVLGVLMDNEVVKSASELAPVPDSTPELIVETSTESVEPVIEEGNT